MVKKIGWFVGGPAKYASVQFRSYYIIDFLKDCGIEVLTESTAPDILVFQKCLHEKELEIALAAKKKGKRIIYDISDNVRSDAEKYLPIFNIAKKYILIADKVVVNGIGLKRILIDKFRSDAVIIEDVYPPEAQKFKKHHVGSKPKLVWQGYFKNMLMYVFGKFMSDFDFQLWQNSLSEPPIDFRHLGYELITISDMEFSLRFLFNHPTHIHPQYPKVCSLLLKGDIGISPLRLWDEDCLGKSANKIVSYMILSIPAIASPVPAYEAVIEHGENGFLARTKNEWLAAFEKLQDPKARQKIGQAGFATVVNQFSIKTIGNKWLKLLKTIN